MRPWLSYILTVMLVLPLHTLSFVNVLQHIAHEDHAADAHDEGHHHDGEADDHDHAPSSHDFSHRHSDEQPIHSHGMEIWGLFVTQGLPEPIAFEPAAAFTFQDPPLHALFITIADRCPGSVFRPPIA